MLKRYLPSVIKAMRRAQKRAQAAYRKAQTRRRGRKVKRRAMEQRQIRVAVVKRLDKDVAGLGKVFDGGRSQVLDM